jgi:hypothetical protein
MNQSRTPTHARKAASAFVLLVVFSSLTLLSMAGCSTAPPAGTDADKAKAASFYQHSDTSKDPFIQTKGSEKN